MSELEKKLERFRSLGGEMRLQLLLGYSKKLPPLPEGLLAARDQGQRMGLREVLGVMRTQGLGAVARRIKSEVVRAAA